MSRDDEPADAADPAPAMRTDAADPAPALPAPVAAPAEPPAVLAPPAGRTRADRRAAADAAATQAPSADVQLAAEAAALPGAHRGGFSRLPTAPVGITEQSAPLEPDGRPMPGAPWGMPAPPLQRGVAGWALGFSIVGLIVSLFVGWGFPLGLVGAVAAIVALRRLFESRQVAVWALVLGILSILYSAGWLTWAATQSALVG